MYNDSPIVMKVAVATIPATAGVALLPATNGNDIGLLLAYGAITIGATALIGQIVVRVLRRYYQARTK